MTIRKLLSILSLLLISPVARAQPEGAVYEGSLTVVEDAAHVSGQRGPMCMAVRTDTLAALTDTTGENHPPEVNNQGSLYMNQTGHAAVAAGVITVTTAGTSVVGTTVTTKECYFTGLVANTLQCFIGGATGDNRSKGLVIGEAQAEGPIHVQNLNLLWFDCGTSGDKVAYFCTN